MEKEIKVAIVCDPIEKFGGAERTLEYLLEEFPNAQVFTARYNKTFVKERFPKLKIKTSFIQYFPFEKYLRQELYLLYPWAYRSFTFLGYDVVISVSAGFAKFVKPLSKKTKHIAKILTPPRFFWMHDVRSIRGMERPSFKFYRFFISTFLEKIWKYWDAKAAKNADVVVSISQEVAKRIKKFYGLESTIIYPPVDVKNMKFTKDVHKRENWFLYCGRVETYKGVELAIRACIEARKPLKIAGVGTHMEQMQTLVRELNAKGLVKFLGYPTDDEVRILMSKCKALLFPVQNEDFGIIPVEANASGAPVIAHRSGGVLETISEENPKTGVFFDEYTPQALAKVLTEFNSEDFDPKNCRKQASNFAGEIFRYKMRNLIRDVLANN